MGLSAIDSFHRGLLNLRSNWELVLIHLGQALTVSVLVVAGFLPILLVAGLGTADALLSTGFPGQELGTVLERMFESWGLFVIAALVAFCVWAIALFVYCYFQAGIFGVLAAADDQAGIVPVPGWRAFRYFGLQRFARAADRLTWRFFWLINLFFLVGSVAILMLGLAVALASRLATGGAETGAFAVGCLALMAAVSGAVVISLWWQLAMAHLARGDTGVVTAVAHGLQVLLRRPAAVVLLAFLAVVAAIAMGVVFLPLSFAVEAMLGNDLWAYLGSQITLALAQSALSGAIAVVFAGALVALMRGETPLERVA
jgi:hypothetical protein